METDLIYHVEFILNGEIAFEAEALMPDQIQEQIIPVKRRGRKPNSTKQADSGASGTIISLIQTGQEIQASAATGSITKSKQTTKAQKKGKGKNLKKRKISDEDDDLDDFEESISNKKQIKYKEEPLKKKLKKGRKTVIQSDDDENENDLQGSEDEAKLLELEGELEEELAHVGEDGEDVDNFEEEDENEDEDDRLEDYVAQERPLNILLKNQRKKDQLQEPISDSNLSEDPNYQKLTKRQKNIVKNNMSGQPEPGEYLQLPNNSTKGNKNGSKLISEEDQLKKLEKDEKRREQMQKQMEDLKRQTVDKILNEAGTKQKKRKEKEDMEKDNRVNHQYRQLPPNEPRIRILNNATTSQVTITPTVYHSILNPNPVVVQNIVEQAVVVNNGNNAAEPAQVVQSVSN